MSDILKSKFFYFYIWFKSGKVTSIVDIRMKQMENEKSEDVWTTSGLPNRQSRNLRIKKEWNLEI